MNNTKSYQKRKEKMTKIHSSGDYIVKTYRSISAFNEKV